MSTEQLLKAAERARKLLRNRSDIESVGVSRNEDGNLCVQVDVDPRTDKDVIHHLLEPVKAPVIVRAVSGVLRAHQS
jgi:cellulose synthase/poly-beta-1,6-N-acetylglucosamine synthase-like glycosyltransferase